MPSELRRHLETKTSWVAPYNHWVSLLNSSLLTRVVSGSGGQDLEAFTSYTPRCHGVVGGIFIVNLGYGVGAWKQDMHSKSR